MKKRKKKNRDFYYDQDYQDYDQDYDQDDYDQDEIEIILFVSGGTRDLLEAYAYRHQLPIAGAVNMLLDEALNDQRAEKVIERAIRASIETIDIEL